MRRNEKWVKKWENKRTDTRGDINREKVRWREVRRKKHEKERGINRGGKASSSCKKSHMFILMCLC